MSHITEPTYRDQFAGSAKADDYDGKEYAHGSYASALWRIEQRQLQRLVGQFRQTHANIDYLDFACGTGRIISFMQHQVDTVTGIEISECMAHLARLRLEKGAIYCRDITAEGVPIEGDYNFITAFRFILNAEPSLRLAAMKALARRLRDDTSWLVFNNHGNLCSHKLLIWPVHTLRRLGQGYRPEGNYLTHRQVAKLATEAGLKIEAVLGCGVMGAKLARLMNAEKLEAREARLADGLWSRYGVNQLYVARRI